MPDLDTTALDSMPPGAGPQSLPAEDLLPSLDPSSACSPSDAAPSPKVRPAKLDYIDALRGIASLSVLFYRLNGSLNMASEWQFPLQIIPERLVNLTMAGVPLFFVISAFTLYLSLDNKSGETKRFTRFYLRRLFRIAPLFYFMLVTVLLHDIIQMNAPSLLEVISNITFTFNLIPQYSESLLSDGWTVGVEMLFYLFLPLIFIKVNNLSRSIIFFACVYWLSPAGRTVMEMIAGKDTISWYWHSNFFQWAPIFPVGIICYIIYKSYLPRIRMEHRTPLALGMLMVSAIILFGFIGNFALSEMIEPLHILTRMNFMSPIAFGLLILSLALSTNRLIVNRVTGLYGKISYSTYLIHPFFIALLAPAYRYIYDHTIISTDLSFFICLALTLVIVTPASLITYRFIESPGIRLGKDLISKL